METAQRGLEAQPAFRLNKCRIGPFGEVIIDMVQGLDSKPMHTFVREPGGKTIDWLDGGRHRALGGINDMVWMSHLALAIEFLDHAGDDALLANRELALEPPSIRPEESERQKSCSVIEDDLVRRSFGIGGVIGMDLAAQGRDFADHRVINVFLHPPIYPAFRQVEQQIPYAVTPRQAFQYRLQLRADTGQAVQALKQWKESLVPHR